MNDHRSSLFNRRALRRFSTAVLLSGLMLLVSGCSRGPSISTHGAGHAITADIQGNHSVTNRESSTTLGSQFGAVTVERTRVRIEGQEWTAIPADVPVTVSIRQHKLRITAGPVTVVRTVSN